MSLLPDSNNCCGVPTCCETDPQQIPGPQGPAGADGEDGSDGQNAFTDLVDQFNQPAVNANVTVVVANRDWISEGQDIFIENGGYYRAIGAGAGSGEFVIKNLGYDANVAPAVLVPAGGHVSPAGEKGEPGEVDTNGALLAANNLNDVNNVATSRASLGLGSMALESTANWLSKAGNLSGLANTATARSNLGLVIGTNVQAFNALLAVIAALAPTVADRLIYTTGVNTVSVATLTSFARTLIDDTTAAAARATLGSVLPRYGILGSLAGVNCNSAGSDNAFTIESSRYRIDKLMIENASINLTTSTCGLFTAAGGGGVTLAADQSMSALTASSKFKDLTLDAVTGTDVQTAGTLYFRIGTAQGSAATVNAWLLGWTLS